MPVGVPGVLCASRCHHWLMEWDFAPFSLEFEFEAESPSTSVDAACWVCLCWSLRARVLRTDSSERVFTGGGVGGTIPGGGKGDGDSEPIAGAVTAEAGASTGRGSVSSCEIEGTSA